MVGVLDRSVGAQRLGQRGLAVAACPLQREVMAMNFSLLGRAGVPGGRRSLAAWALSSWVVAAPPPAYARGGRRKGLSSGREEVPFLLRRCRVGAFIGRRCGSQLHQSSSAARHEGRGGAGLSRASKCSHDPGIGRPATGAGGHLLGRAAQKPVLGHRSPSGLSGWRIQKLAAANDYRRPVAVGEQPVAWRMRWNPSGSAWSRNRRMNSPAGRAHDLGFWAVAAAAPVVLPPSPPRTDPLRRRAARCHSCKGRIEIKGQSHRGHCFNAAGAHRRARAARMAGARRCRGWREKVCPIVSRNWHCGRLAMRRHVYRLPSRYKECGP